ncbi:MAG: hypothetical protein COB23_04885 [Methylophaga sp.]|nr:MAG: hypothetical protein COB23_04885 [Methylophaga sp.]
MSKFFFEHDSLKQVAAISWLLLILLVVFFAFKTPPTIDSNIMALLPLSEQQPIVQKATTTITENFSKRLILVLSGNDEQQLHTEVEALANHLQQMPDIAEVEWKITPQDRDRAQQERYPYRFMLLDKYSREQLLSADFDALYHRALMQLYNPISVGKKALIEDPFGLSNAISTNQHQSAILVIDSLLKIKNLQQPSYLLLVTLAADPFLSTLQTNVLTMLDDRQSILTQLDIDLTMSGMLLHAAAGERQAKHEISTIGLSSLLAILLIMLWVFRQFKPLLLLLFPILIGCLSATAITILVFDRIHLVTLAFGAGLVGVSVDYALHFLCERHLSPAKTVLKKIMPGLILGLFSSVMAYAVQIVAPFPGLQQMAVFSVVGLSASWLTVVLWFPLLTNTFNARPLLATQTLDRLRQSFPRAEHSPLLLGALIIAVMFSLSILWSGNSVDDIRLLQTSPANLLAEDKKIQTALGGNNSAQFLLVSADDLEQCLQKEEQITKRLDTLQAEGILDGYQALSQALPSLNRQAENVKLVQQLYDQQLSAFYHHLKLSKNSVTTAQQHFKQSTSTLLSPDVWQQQYASKAWQNFIVPPTANTAATMIRFTGILNDKAKQALASLADDHVGILYIDRIDTISKLMSKYRIEGIDLVLKAYLCVWLILFFRYKSQVWRIILPPLLASIFTLSILMTLEQGVNLFHWLALILVLGIGLDMGIFLTETKESAYTWLAVSLSSLTSILAFGLLSLSDTPVLHHFGLTVLLGLIFVWLLAPMMRKVPT